MKEDIYFPEVLRIEDSYCSQQLQARSGGQKGVLNTDFACREYRLYSVINHRGMDATKGHYVSWVLDSSNDWYLCDDNKVKKALNKDLVLESQAYLLFYEKII
jgi:ubiquitin C-terminal hydrolase